MEPTSRLSVEIGLQDDDSMESNTFMKLNYVLCCRERSIKPTIFSASNQAYNYGKIIYDLYVKRNLVGIARNIINETNLNSDKLAENLIENAENDLYNLSQSGNTDRSFNSTIESTSSDFLSTGGFKTSRTGLGIGTGFEQYQDLFVNLDLSTYYEKLDECQSLNALAVFGGNLAGVCFETHEVKRETVFEDNKLVIYVKKNIIFSKLWPTSCGP